MANPEEMKRYFWFFFGVLGVVFFWAGVWEGIGHLGPLKSPWVSLLVGIILLTIGGIIRKTDQVKQQDIVAKNALHKVHTHPQKPEFHIKYFDKLKKQEILLNGKQLQRIEKGFLVFLEQSGKELFIPIHRVTEILHLGKSFKKLK